MTSGGLTIDRVCSFLAEIAPLRLAESWDNVGLLVGDRTGSAERVMTCLTITPAVVDEAEREDVDLIVTHHPLPFKPFSRLTTDSVSGRLLLRLAAARTSVYCAHTAFDSAAAGINQQLCERLDVRDPQPLEPADPTDPQQLGSGRYGALGSSQPLGQLARRATESLGGSSYRLVGDENHLISRVGCACGSGGSFLGKAARKGCDALITGEANFHGCLEAEALGIGLVLVGHYHSERFAMELLARQLAAQFEPLRVWCSHSERDPLRSFSV